MVKLGVGARVYLVGARVYLIGARVYLVGARVYLSLVIIVSPQSQLDLDLGLVLDWVLGDTEKISPQL